MPYCTAAATGCLMVLVSVPLCANETRADRLDLKLSWKDNLLTISGPRLPGGRIDVWYIEAYCRPGSTDRPWDQTVIGHRTTLISSRGDATQLKLRCQLSDGVVVHHDIRVVDDGLQFDLMARNPTDQASLAHWAQPCIRVDGFTGRTQETYLEKSFIFLDGKQTRMPTPRWARQARYVPGQVWCPKHISRDDVNPRPLSEEVPTNGLIGCFSRDDKMILATAWEPYQELFQGVIVCLHSDFRIGGLDPGQTKRIRGKIYLVDADVEDLLRRYRRDFPEHVGL